MKGCWSEGDLRAFLDGELVPEEMTGISAHLRDCAECDGRRRELAGRAVLVSSLIRGLTAEAPRVVAMPARPAVRWRRWAGVAAAIAAGFVIGILTLPRPGEEVPPAPVARGTGTLRLPAPEPGPAVQAIVPLAVEPISPRLARAPADRKRAPAARPAALENFIALDSEPFEAGLIVRVALGVEQIPADVVFSADGRARAYRLVTERSNE